MNIEDFKKIVFDEYGKCWFAWDDDYLAYIYNKKPDLETTRWSDVNDVFDPLIDNNFLEIRKMIFHELFPNGETWKESLIEIKEEPKVGDFGVFWDDYDPQHKYTGFLCFYDKNSEYSYISHPPVAYKNFKKCTLEEARKIIMGDLK